MNPDIVSVGDKVGLILTAEAMKRFALQPGELLVGVITDAGDTGIMLKDGSGVVWLMPWASVVAGKMIEKGAGA